jgi:hypothetical protein
MSIFSTVADLSVSGAKKAKKLLKEADFFSQAQKSSEKIERKKGDYQSFFNDLTKKLQVKPDELKAIGFDKQFKGRSEITRDEIQEFLENNPFSITEKVYGNQATPHTVKPFHSGGYQVVKPDGSYLGWYENKADAQLTADAATGSGTNTGKFDEYTLTSGNPQEQNYREILLKDNRLQERRDYVQRELKKSSDVIGKMKTDIAKLEGSNHDYRKLSEKELFNKYYPDIDTDSLIERHNELIQAKSQIPPSYSHPHHFPEDQDVIAHLRMNDRIDDEGNKVLVIEELQSDLHQKGKKTGYSNETLEQAYKDRSKYEEIMNEFYYWENWAERNRPDLYEKLKTAKKDKSIAYENQFLPEDQKLEMSMDGNPMVRHREIKSEILDALDKDQFQKTGVDPEQLRAEIAPKLTEARKIIADQEQAMPDIPYKSDDKSSYYDLGLKKALLEAVNGGYDKLAITTGEQQLRRYPVDPEGMEQFYDHTYPNKLAKLVKQDGVKLGKTKLPTNFDSEDAQLLSDLDLGDMRKFDEVNSIDITPAMRERVLKGLPLFSPNTLGAAVLAPSVFDIVKEYSTANINNQNYDMQSIQDEKAIRQNMTRRQRRDNPPSEALRNYEQGKILPTLQNMGVGLVEGAADTLDIVNPLNLGLNVLNPLDESAMRFLNPAYTPSRDAIKPLSDMRFYDQTDPDSEQARKNARMAGALFSPI